jgi:hypothetical protein
MVILATSLLFGPVRSGWAFFDELSGELSIEKERQIGEEFLLELQQYYPLVEDPFITSYFNQLGQKLAAQIGPQPFHYKFFIVIDPSMNAFAVPGGYIFLHTGRRSGGCLSPRNFPHLRPAYVQDDEKISACHCRQFNWGAGVGFPGRGPGAASADGFHGRGGKRHAEI